MKTKRRRICSLFTLMAITILGMTFGCKTPKTGDGADSPFSKMPAGRLTMVSYNYQGMRMMLVSSPTVTLGEDGKTIMTFSKYTEDRSFEVSDTILDAARKIIEEEKMYNYASRYDNKFNDMILDGYSWNFSAKFDSGETIYSGGRNAQPDGDGLHRIGRLLSDAGMKCLAEAGELESE